MRPITISKATRVRNVVKNFFVCSIVRLHYLAGAVVVNSLVFFIEFRRRGGIRLK
ncbi:MAG: hypothetical protein UW09_C0003G0121 [candidate division TM6 bacterium GW2011_GWF2_43_87]|nr:MAG: hypothetical protein UW09_C0003G0121 [candidate division TM6 bacterium GW2011_GWF2_43_87]